MWDQLKGFIVQVILIPPIIAGLIFCIQWGGDYFYFYTWLFVFTVTMVSMALLYCQCGFIVLPWFPTDMGTISNYIL